MVEGGPRRMSRRFIDWEGMGMNACLFSRYEASRE